jgi:hypothetical protein
VFGGEQAVAEFSQRRADGRVPLGQRAAEVATRT